MVGVESSGDLARQVFSLELPDIPSTTWAMIESILRPSREEAEGCQDELYPVAHLLWRVTAALTLHWLWVAQLRQMDTRSVSASAHTAMFNVAWHNGLLNLCIVVSTQHPIRQIGSRECTQRQTVNNVCYFKDLASS